MIAPILIAVEGAYILAPTPYAINPEPIACVPVDEFTECEVLPGRAYTITGGRSGPAFSLSVFVPCLADVDRDGVLTISDFDAWYGAYGDGLPQADINQDGTVSPEDFGAWLAAFNRGCV